jgi:AcrR family transcriptional regulator
MTIGELARRAGVAVSTIRAWEQRYGLLTPARSTGGHRRYSVEDLRRLRAVQALVEAGVTLTAAADQIMGKTWAQDRWPPSRTILSVPALDPVALRAAYRATRSLLYIGTAGDAAEILRTFVVELGGQVVPADDAGPDALALDLSLDDGPAVRAVVDPFSVARPHLERILPTLVEDARRAVTITGRRRTASGTETPG